MESFEFDMPKNKNAVIKVVGVGGGGNNAVNYMYNQGIEGVDFVVCNTDAQALANSPISNKLQLGVSITEGLGAGANPEIGEQAAIESKEDIKALFNSNTKLIFITAGMGGGTGTGAAPIIAEIAKDLGILTVAIVTYPFHFEGSSRLKAAEAGIEKLRQSVDSLIVINNNKLRDLFGNLGYKSGFSKADEVLADAARGIAEVITQNYTINIDLRDAKTVLQGSGTSIMGSAQAQGENRAKEAIMAALDSPLLNDNKITGAKNVLLLIVSGSEEITIDEIGTINEFIQNEAGNNANIIMGIGEDESLENAISVTIVATGFPLEHQEVFSTTASKKVYHTLKDDQPISKTLFEKEIKEEAPIENKGIQDGNITRYELEDDFDEEEENDMEFKNIEDSMMFEIEEEEVEFTVRSMSEEELKNQQNPNANFRENIEETETQETEFIEEKSHQQTTIFSLNDLEEEQMEIKSAFPNENPADDYKQDFNDAGNDLPEETLKKIEDRRRRLMQFNTKYENLTKNIEETEKIPAYKRKGIELDESQESKTSKFYLDSDDDDIQIRPNNFFEDNVD